MTDTNSTPPSRAALIELMAEAIEPSTFTLPKCNLYRADYNRAFARAADALTALEAAGCRVVPVEAALTLIAATTLVETAIKALMADTAAGIELYRVNPPAYDVDFDVSKEYQQGFLDRMTVQAQEQFPRMAVALNAMIAAVTEYKKAASPYAPEPRDAE